MKRLIPIILLLPLLGACEALGGAVLGSALSLGGGYALDAFEDKAAAKAVWRDQVNVVAAQERGIYLSEALRLAAMPDLSEKDVKASERRMSAVERAFERVREALDRVKPKFLIEEVADRDSVLTAP